MANYLEEAAALLRKASETNESRNAQYGATLYEQRTALAHAFAELAAIDKGLVPERVAESVYDHYSQARRS